MLRLLFIAAFSLSLQQLGAVEVDRWFLELVRREFGGIGNGIQYIPSESLQTLGRGAFNHFMAAPAVGPSAGVGLRAPRMQFHGSPIFYTGELDYAGRLDYRTVNRIKENLQVLKFAENFGGPQIKGLAFTILAGEDLNSYIAEALVERVPGLTLSRIVKNGRYGPELLHSFDHLAIRAYAQGYFAGDMHGGNLIWDAVRDELRPIDVEFFHEDFEFRRRSLETAMIKNTIAFRKTIVQGLRAQGYSASEIGRTPSLYRKMKRSLPLLSRLRPIKPW